MQARIWSDKQGYTVQTSAGHVWQLIKLGVNQFRHKDCGTGSDKYTGPGKLCKGIPTEIKSMFFKLQKGDTSS